MEVEQSKGKARAFQVLQFSPWVNADNDVEIQLFGRTADAASVCVRVRHTPSHILMQVPATLEVRVEYVADIECRMREHVLAYLASNTQKCSRIKCACGKFPLDAKGVTWGLCSRDLKKKYDFRDPIKRVDVVKRFPYKVYQKLPSEMVRFQLDSPQLVAAASDFLRKEIASQGWTTEIFSVVADPLMSFFDEAAEAGKPLGGMDWVSLDYLECLPPASRVTSCDVEFVVEFEALRPAPAPREPAPFKVLAFDLETATDGSRLSQWLRGAQNSKEADDRIAFERAGRAVNGLYAPTDGDAILCASICVSGATTPRRIGLIYGAGDVAPFRRGFVPLESGETDAPRDDGAEIEVVRCADERELILKFSEIVRAEAPDVLTGYNIEKFDIPYIFGRAALWGVLDPFSRLSRVRSHVVRFAQLDRGTVGKGQYQIMVFDAPGLWVLDAITFVKTTHRELDLYNLKHVAEKLLGDKKVDMPIKNIVPYFRGTPEQRRHLLWYCVHDSDLALMVVQKEAAVVSIGMEANVRGVSPHQITILGQQATLQRLMYRVACQGEPDKRVVFARHATQIVETETKTQKQQTLSHWLVPKENQREKSGSTSAPATPRGRAEKEKEKEQKQVIPAYARIPPPPRGKNNKEYEGAIVLDPLVGLYQALIATLDFASLYPSLMRSHNLDARTLLESREHAYQQGLGDDDIQKWGDYWWVRPHVCEGIAPRALTYLLEKRKQVRVDLKHINKDENLLLWNSQYMQQLKLKEGANSIYGMFGATTSWAFCVYVAATVTNLGRMYITKVRDFIQNPANFSYEEAGVTKSYRVLYGDTDSVMVHAGPWVDETRGFETHAELYRKVNSARLFPAGMEIAADSLYSKYLLKAKKSYAAVKHEAGKAPIRVVKGMQSERREFPLVVRTALGHVLDMMLVHGNTPTEIWQYVYDYVGSIYARNVSFSDLVVTIQLRKEPTTAAEWRTEHAAVVREWRQLDPATAPTPGDRVPFCYARVANDRAPAFERTHAPWMFHESPDRKDISTQFVDYDYYVTLLAKPMMRLLDTIFPVWEMKALFSRENHTRVSVSKRGDEEHTQTHRPNASVAKSTRRRGEFLAAAVSTGNIAPSASKKQMDLARARAMSGRITSYFAPVAAPAAPAPAAPAEPATEDEYEMCDSSDDDDDESDDEYDFVDAQDAEIDDLADRF